MADDEKRGQQAPPQVHLYRDLVTFIGMANPSRSGMFDDGDPD